MKQNVVRLMILCVLIVLCIGQTMMLWLGDMSGHHFFADHVAAYVTSYVHPKQVWCNIQGNIKSSIKESTNSGIYRLESEKETLMEELIKELRKEGLMFDLSPKEQYTSLLNGTQGMIYEFGTQLTLDEIIGQSVDTSTKKYQSIKIKEIYVDLSATDAYKTYIYLIDEEARVRQKITLNNQLKSGIEIVNLYADKENVTNRQVYQASISSASDRDFFVGNTFYPQVASSTTIKGKTLQFKPIIEDLEGKELENYVNYLFKTPSNKKRNLIETGVAFSNNLNISVKYHTVGMLEFTKTPLNDNEKASYIERMNTISTFIEESGAIPEFLKKGLYLETVYTQAETGETIYQFGYHYEDGQVVILSDQAKEQLGINSFLELGIKNSEVTSGKWMMLEPYEMVNSATVKMGSSEAINAIYEHSGLIEFDEYQLDDLDCVYRIQDIQKKSEFGWVGFYKDQPVYAIEKIDNE